MKNNNVIIIEGTRNNNNGSLREGFHKLFLKDLEEGTFRIQMGDGKDQAIAKFKSIPEASLLCDLDSTNKEDIGKDLIKNKLQDRKNEVFYMIPKMEVLLLSQPEILNKYYGQGIKEINKASAIRLAAPDEFLREITKNTKKRAYHKVKHAAELLAMLDANLLKKDFPEYRELIECLKNKSK